MKQNNILGILITILIGIFVFLVGIDSRGEASPVLVYKVYLNGKSIGLIESEKELYDLIDEKQKSIKEKYNVDKVYPPKGLDIKQTYTFNDEVYSANKIYDIIQDQDPFTISGYTAVIRYPENEENQKETININVLNKEHFEEAFTSVIEAFVGTEKYEAFATDSQQEIVDVGSLIESIDWEENITIKENLISVDADIYTDSNDVSKYLLFGTLEQQESYTIKEGDDISTVAYNNKLSNEEFLIVNPEFTSDKVLLAPGKNVNIGLIQPLITIVSEHHVVEDITESFKVEYIEDSDSYVGTEKVVQEGVDGITRVTEKILYKNGEISNFVIDRGLSTIIKPSINKVISKGTKNYSSGTYVNTGNENWYWPTLSPYKITSYFGYRWGKHHNGIDISGTGQGSPIYSSTDGVVVDTNNNCPNNGRGLSDTCGGAYGNFVHIKTASGENTVMYAHMTQNIRVGIGSNVTRGQIIGFMGNSGRSSGTHLHLEIRASNGAGINPCRVYGC